MIRGIRKMLCFQAERRVLSIGDATFSSDRTIQIIAAVELDSGLVGQHLKHPSATRFVNFRRLG